MKSDAEAGFNLVILVVVFTVLNIGVAAALPVWSHFIQREKEAELIFRGLQYAEAIRVCQLPNRLGRLPVRLEELLEVEPRCIRQLYPNPMTEDGRWGLIFETGAGARGRPANQGGNIPAGEDRRRDTEDDSDFGGGAQPPGLRPDANGDLRSSGAEGEVAAGPIKGVHSIVGGAAIKVFFDQTDYGDWSFTYDLLQMANTGGQQPGAPPRPVNAAQLGRPFPPGITPPQLPGVAPGLNPADPNAVPGPGSPLNPGTGGAQPQPRNPRRSG